MLPRRATTQPTGYVLIDKPVGPSSNQAVQSVRRALGVGGKRGTKGGHAGTLDPFASGLLLVLLGHATKLMPYVVGHDKRYLVGVRFGASSDTDDATGVLTPSDASLPERAAVERACRDLAATTTQVPPAVSAIHINGRRAYARVRAGETVEVPARDVVFHAIDIVAWRGDAEVVLDVKCGSGTYMRALARDLGDAVGCPAHCSTLRRTAVGAWQVEDAVAVDDVTATDVHDLLELDLLPRATVSSEDAVHLAHGRSIAIHEAMDTSCRAAGAADHFIAVDTAGAAIAVVQRHDDRLRTTSLLIDSPAP